jgi:signal peptidase I
MNKNAISLSVTSTITQEKKLQLYTLHGGSMYPTLRDGDKVLAIPPRHLKRGDVVIFRRNAAMIAHRIVSLDEHFIITRGDHTIHEDKRISREEVVGIVRYVIRGKCMFVFKNNNLIAHVWFLQKFNLYIQEQVIKKFLLWLQKKPFYRVCMIRVLRIVPEEIDMKMEERNKDLVFKFFHRSHSVGVIRIDTITLQETLLYVRRVYQALGMESIMRMRVQEYLKKKYTDS